MRKKKKLAKQILSLLLVASMITPTSLSTVRAEEPGAQVEEADNTQSPPKEPQKAPEAEAPEKGQKPAEPEKAPEGTPEETPEKAPDVTEAVVYLDKAENGLLTFPIPEKDVVKASGENPEKAMEEAIKQLEEQPAKQKTAVGEPVTVYAASDYGYRIKSLKVLDKESQELVAEAPQDALGSITFPMPGKDVVVTAEFSEIPEEEIAEIENETENEDVDLDEPGKEGKPVSKARAAGISTYASKSIYLNVPSSKVYYGTYNTRYYTTNEGKYAYCLEPLRKAPKAGWYSASTLNNDYVRKAAYYAYGGPGYNTFVNRYGRIWDGSQAFEYAYSHVIIAYVYAKYYLRNNSEAGYAFHGISTSVKNSLVKKADQILSMPNPPSGYTVYYMSTNNVNGNQRAQAMLCQINNPGQLTLKKSSSSTDITNGNSLYNLNGAQYGVYSNSACTTKVATLTTNASGAANTVTLNPGTYYVKETTAPTGYEKDTKTYTVSVGSCTTYTLNVKDDPINDPAVVKISKQDAASGITIQGGASLAGAQFTINYYNNLYTKDNLPAAPTRKWIIETKEVTNSEGKKVYMAMLDKGSLLNGSSPLYELGGVPTIPRGTVTIQETKAPEGYQKDLTMTDAKGNSSKDGLYLVQIQKEGDMSAVIGSQGLIGKDTVYRGDFSFTKIKGSNNSRMANIPFKITNVESGENHTVYTDANGFYSSQSSYAKHSSNTNGGKAGAGTWFGDKNALDDNVGALPYGTYMIEELACDANAGLVLHKGTFKIDEADHGKLKELGTIVNTSISMETFAMDGASGANLFGFLDKTTNYETGESYYSIYDEAYLNGVDTGYVEGMLVDKATGEYILGNDGKPLKGGSPLYEQGDGIGGAYVEIRIDDPSKLVGKDVVVFERAYALNPNGTPNYNKLIVSHEDLESETQTVHYQALETELTDKATGIHMIQTSNKSTILRDKVRLTNITEEAKKQLLQSLDYGNIDYFQLNGLLVDDKGNPVIGSDGDPVTAISGDFESNEITEENLEILTNGFALEYVLDQATVNKYKGQKLHSFVEIYYAWDLDDTWGNPWTLWTYEKDLNNESQTVTIPAITGTQVSKDIVAETDGGITDKVDLIGLTPRETYSLKGQIVDKATGDVIVSTKNCTYGKDPVNPLYAVPSADANYTVSDLGDVRVYQLLVEQDADGVAAPAGYYIKNATTKQYVSCDKNGITDGKTAIDAKIFEQQMLCPGETYVEARTLEAKKSFEAGTETDSQYLNFTFDASELAGKSYVVTEELYFGKLVDDGNYQITYNLNGTDKNPNPSYYSTEYGIILKEPVKKGYEFTGWTGSNGTEPQKEVVVPEGAVGDLFYEAHWKVKSFTATFDPNGGSVPSVTSITKNYGEPLGTLPVTGQEGSVFKGWFTEKTGGTRITAETLMESDSTYYAQWDYLPILQTGPLFNKNIPDNITAIEFTDLPAPVIDTSTGQPMVVKDVSDRQNGSVVQWVEGTTLKVSSQKLGQKVIANANSSNMFNGDINNGNRVCKTLSSISAQKLDTSNVTDMSFMLYNAGYNTTSFNIDLSNWNVGNVTDMSSMFSGTGYNTTSFNIDLSNWNVGNVTNMTYMFFSAGNNATSWNIGNLNNWNTENVTNMSSMFSSTGYSATSFNIDLSNWNVGNVTDMSSMFSGTGYNTTSFNIDLSNWNVGNVTNMSSMFSSTGYSATSWNIGGLSNWDVGNVTYMSNMFMSAGYSATSFNIDLSNWNVGNVTDMSHMFSYAGHNATSWNIGGLSNWDVGNVTYMSNMFMSAGYSATSFNIDLSNWDVGNATDMSSMFSSTGYSATSWNIGDLSNWDVGNVTQMSEFMSGMFSNAGYSATSWSIGDLSNWDVGNVIDMSYMFSSAGHSATSFNIDLSNWDVGNVTYMSSMFSSTGYSATSFNIDLSNWNVGNVTDMSSMFSSTGHNATSWNIGGLSNWDVGNVTYMSHMFSGTGYNATSFNIDLSNWNVGNVTDMSHMFSYAGENAKSWNIGDLSNWDVGNVTDMSYMFGIQFNWGDKKNPINIGDLTDWNTTNVVNMDYMFSYCSSLSSSITIRGDVTLYNKMFSDAATASGAKFVVNYTSETSSLVDRMIATKTSNSNVVKGTLVKNYAPSTPKTVSKSQKMDLAPSPKTAIVPKETPDIKEVMTEPIAEKKQTEKKQSVAKKEAPMKTMSAPVTPKASNRILGDVDGDGVLTIRDGKLISYHYTHIIELTGDAFTAADMNGDGKLDIFDVQTLMNLVAQNDPKLLYEHKNLNDQNQTFYVPKITTKIVEEGYAPSSNVKITDRVSYSGLIPNKTYTLTGELMDQETGVTAKDVNGNLITAEKTFTASSTGTGTADVVFNFNGTNLAGVTLVAFETLRGDAKIYGGESASQVLATHQDINDADQTIAGMTIATKAKDQKSGTSMMKAEAGAAAVDTVSYKGAPVGEKFVAVGTLMDTYNDIPVTDASGKVVQVEQAFTPTAASGSVDVVFNFNSSEMGGAYVFYEKIYHIEADGSRTLWASHEDPNDEAQTITVARIDTNIYDVETMTNVSYIKEQMEVRDLVYYSGLLPGKSYTLNGSLMDASTNAVYKDATGKSITGTVTFTPESSDGEVEMVFKFNGTNIKNGKLVAYEELVYNGSVLASEKDINNEYQTLLIPTITTNAKDQLSGSKVLKADKNSTIVDTVSFQNIQIGMVHELRATLMDKATGKALTDADGKPITGLAEMEPDTSSGTQDVLLTFNGTNLKGKTVVVYEELWLGDQMVAYHKDLNDTAQTLSIPGISTKAVNTVTGTQEGNSGTMTIRDTVTYQNLKPGQSYTLSGQVMDKETGKVITVGGKAVEGTKTLVPASASGSTTMDFTFNTSGLEGKELVVFETLSTMENGRQMIAAEHTDLNDVDQTITMPSMTYKSCQVIKRIKASDYRTEHGEPAFFFKLEGTDTAGEKHTYRSAAIFTEDYVKANTDKDGYVSITMKFEDVPSGTYTVTEDKTARFALESIDGLVNATKTASSAIYDLEKNDTASSRFTNKKTEWAYDGEVNTIVNHMEDGK